jgi:hypothetical protein
MLMSQNPLYSQSAMMICSTKEVLHGGMGTTQQSAVTAEH